MAEETTKSASAVYLVYGIIMECAPFVYVYSNPEEAYRRGFTFALGRNLILNAIGPNPLNLNVGVIADESRAVQLLQDGWVFQAGNCLFGDVNMVIVRKVEIK